MMAILVSQYAFSKNRVIPFFESKELTPYWPSQNNNYSPATVGKFKAINQHEEKITQESFRNKYSLINFFFVQCPEICPMMMRNVKRLQKTIGAKNKKIQIFSFSVLPETDTPERLREYAESYNIKSNNWSLLTGDKKDIYNVGKNMFKADGAVGTQRSEDNFIHTQNIYLVDEKLRIRGIYNTSDIGDMKQLKEDIELLN